MSDSSPGWGADPDPRVALPRCPICHSTLIGDALGTLVCGACEADLTGRDLAAPVQPDNIHIYPVMQWVWAPCQVCGAELPLEDSLLYEQCPDCYEPLRIKVLRRSVLEGPHDDRPEVPAELRADESSRDYFLLGDRAVATGMVGVLLLGAGPFTGLRVCGTWATGHLDLVDPYAGTLWEGVPRHGIIRPC